MATTAPVQPGDILGGKYRVECVLGAGGMGVVVAARHTQLGQLVALKFLLPAAAQQAEIVERFQREARAAVQLRSEHVARVFDVGTLDATSSAEARGMPYIVMEYLEGKDLAAIAQQGPLPIADAVTYVLQVCDALQEAHSLGIVHRDLKPANLFLTRRPNGTPLVKVLDFGISKMPSQSGADEHLTATTAVLGTPLYMSPEQMRSTRSAEPRSDLWSLGAVLYKLLTGKPPFPGATITEICSRVVSEEPTLPRDLRRDVPPGLETVVLRCLQKDPAHRFGSAAELATALVLFAQPSQEAALQPAPPEPTVPLIGPTPSAVTPTISRTDVAWDQATLVQRRKGKRSVLAALAGALVCAAAAGAIVYVRAHESDEAEVPPSQAAPLIAATSAEPAEEAPAPASAAAPSVHSTTALSPAPTASTATGPLAVRTTPTASAPARPPASTPAPTSRRSDDRERTRK